MKHVTRLFVSLVLQGVMFAQGQVKNFQETLTGYEEVPSISTTANGTFHARISNDGSSIDYTLSYSALTGDVQQAHIHFGQVGVNGGISVFLCTNLGNGPAGTQACPAGPATITGTITAANVIGPAVQGLAPGEFAELIAAIHAGRAYANVHSSTHTGGEIRAQIDSGAGK
jgi:hypothetical protein